MCRMARLSDRAAIEVFGADARTFLHGIITNDLLTAPGGAALHAGLLTPQGKILFDFFVVPAGAKEGVADGKAERFFLECRAEIRDDLIRRLMFYRLRARVEIRDRSDRLQIVAVWDGGPERPGGLAFTDPRLEAMGLRCLVEPGAVPDCEDETEAAYHAHRIALGVPEGGLDYAFGDTFPHEANFDQLGGVSFSKGCYVGQEVVSRMQHKTVVRKRIVPLKGNGSLPPSGTDIVAEDFPIGKLGSSAGDRGLALIRLDRAQKALEEGRALRAGDVEIELLKPAWATFDVPGQRVAAGGS